MRFINTTTLKFQTVADGELERLEKGYSILSHRWTWGDGEILYQDVLSMDAGVQAKGAYSKLLGSCALAKKLGYDLIWIDTCCIDKTDSVELGEAINSMYRWYANSNVCIVYLEDVSSSEQIETSEWFKRGWTLQELIAPKTALFYDTHWTFLGDKVSLSDTLTQTTLIPQDVLQNEKQPQVYSIAQRMSWAAKRTTSRLEDRAYSLMGLFDVNMPMIYGERERAFMRLQQQIITQSADESMFAWDLDLLDAGRSRDPKQTYCGLLAPSPASFARCGDVISLGRSQGFHINQFGLNISLATTTTAPGILRACLQVGKSEAAGWYAVFLQRLNEEDTYARISSPSGESYVLTEHVGTLLRVSVPLAIVQPPVRIYPGFWLRKFETDERSILGYHVLSRHYTREDDRMTLLDNSVGTAGIIGIEFIDGAKRRLFSWLKLGFNTSYQPTCCIILPELYYDSRISSGCMMDQCKALQKIPGGSDAWVNHPAFNDNWVENYTDARKGLPGVQMQFYRIESATGSFDRGFELALTKYDFHLAIKSQRVPDIEQRRWDAPVEIWAIDIVTENAPTKRQDDNACCC